ncbi:uncharacterized protein JCM10292_005155 [Rhodotorula paludigena]|uniref:uncharacterized protein n=1 Tax=Rhodotorula paludigena TaxID=86838 RepID=UPI00317CDB9C
MGPLARPVSSADLHRRASSSVLPPAPAHHSGGGSGASASRLKLGLAVERDAYVAGQTLRGVLEVAVKGEIALGEIGLELCGTEELRSRDHTSTRRLLATRVDFQGNGLPPSNAVVPGSRPIQSSFYPALPGRTRFAFTFTIPADMPSTCALGSNATTRYELRAFASSLCDGNVDIRSEKLEVRVVERWADWREGEWNKGVKRSASEKLAIGGDGKLDLVASVGKGEWVERPPRLFWRADADMEVAGKGKIEVHAKVHNLSKRHVTGLKVSLVRRLRILYPADSRPLVEPPIVSSTILTERFHGIDYDVRAGGERDVVLPLQVPTDECWTVRKGSLFELDIVTRVEVECGFLQKALTVDLPIWIAHPLSLPNSAHRFADEERARLAPVPPVTAQSSIPYSPSTVGFASPAPYQAMSPEPYAASAADHHLPLPGTPAPGQQRYAASTVSMSSSVSSPAMYPPPTPAPYFPPPPAAPAELYDPVPAAQPTSSGYVHFDPTVPDLTASRFLDSLQQQQPGQVHVSPESTFSSHMSAQDSPLPPHTAVTPQAPPQGYGSLSYPHQQQHFAPRPPSRAHTIASELNLPPHEAAQVEANLAPVEPYSGMRRAHQHSRTSSDLPYLQQQVQRAPSRIGEGVRQNSAPPAAHYGHGADGESRLDMPLPPSPPRLCPSPVPSHRDDARSPSTAESAMPPPPVPMRNRPPMQTPPPPSPSSHFRAQSRSPSPSPAEPVSSSSAFSQVGSMAAPSGLLETIGEDGESQAGTARSAMLPAGMADALKADADARELGDLEDSPGRSSAQDLEELVEEEERRAEREKVDQEEKSPSPLPFPTDHSERTKDKDARPRAQDLFSPTSSSPIPPSSPSPSLTLSAPPPKRELNGLSALERRLLSRPTTPDLSALSPSRSPSPIKPLGSPAPHASFDTADGSALRARSISRASRDARMAEELRRAEEDPAEAVRRAVAKAEWAKKPAFVAMKAAQDETPIAMVKSEELKEIEAQGEMKGEAAVMDVRQEVEDESSSTSRPAMYEPLVSTSPSPSAAAQLMVQDVAPPSPRRPLPSPPPSPRRALPSPPSPARASASTESISRTIESIKLSDPPSSPSKSANRPVFTSKRSTLPPLPNEAPFCPPSPTEVGGASQSSSKSPVKAAAPSPWSSRPSPWSTRAHSPLPASASAPVLHPAAGTEAQAVQAPRSPITAAPVDPAGRKVVNAAELKGLKRDAVDRIAGWLKNADAEPLAEAQPAADAEAPLPSKRFTIEFGRLAPAPPSSSSGATSTAASPRPTSPSTFTASQRGHKPTHSEPSVAQLLAAESRAALRAAEEQASHVISRSSAVKKGLDGYLAALKSDAEVHKDDLAHKSAKATKPGKVRSVASIWAERVEEADRERTASPPPTMGHKPTKSLSSIQLGSASSPVSSKPLAPVDNSAAPPRTRPISLQVSPSASRSPPAKPFLNTTLGRPSGSAAALTSARNMRVSSAGKLSTSESAPTGLASSGGKKVADLLARYQQQIA